MFFIRHPLWGQQACGIFPPPLTGGLRNGHLAPPPPLCSNRWVLPGHDLPPLELCPETDDLINDIFNIDTSVTETLTNKKEN